MHSVVSHISRPTPPSRTPFRESLTYQCLSHGIEIPPHRIGVAVGAESLEIWLMGDDGGAVGSFCLVEDECFFDAVEPFADLRGVSDHVRKDEG